MKAKWMLISLPLFIGLGIALLWVVLVGAVAQAAPQAELHVCPSGCPYASVQAAVDAAQPGDEVKVAEGTYTDIHHIEDLDTDTFTATQVVAIDKSLTIRGGYTSADWTTPDPVAHPTILDAGGLGRVMVIRSASPVTIEGLRITGGDASALGGHYSSDRDAGGGVHVYDSTIEFKNCSIDNNSAHSVDWAQGYGGGIYIESSDVTLENNQVSDNTGSKKGHGYGGGLFLYDSHYATLKGNQFSGNFGASTANGSGGGIYLYYSEHANVEGNIIINNVGSGGANYYGGGLLMYQSDYSILKGNLIRGNTGGQAWSWGGGLYIDQSDDVLVLNNSIVDNIASTYDGWGGGIYLRLSYDFTMDGNLVRNNTGTSRLTGSSWGGGLYIERGGVMTLTNNAFIDNQVNTAGSGIYIYEAYPSLLHNTIARNLGGDGSGVYITGTNKTVAMTNTIIFSQTVGITVSVNSTAVLNTSLWYENDLNWAGTGTINHSNDLSGAPAFAEDGFHLTPPSAAIDQGLGIGVMTDIDGDPRPIWQGYDIGADEHRSRIFAPLVLRG